MLLKKNKKNILILIGIATILTTGIAFAANGGLRDLFPNLSLDKDFSDIIESPRQMTSPFNMTELPEYFNASVVVKGSGYTGQPHTVYIMISHTRPDSSVWLAAGDYSLTLESGGEVLGPIIATGMFSKLRNTVPFKSQDFPWTPEITAGTMYNLVLNLDNLTWTSAYTITATADPGGSMVSGPTTVEYGVPTNFTVLEGDPHSFNIIPDAGYEIADVLVDGISEGTISSYLFTSVTKDHTISATFSLIEYTITATAGIGGRIESEGITVSDGFHDFNVQYGQSQTFTAIADTGYMFDCFLIDTVPTYFLDTHTFTDVTADHTIHATFKSTIVNFVDYDPIMSDPPAFMDPTIEVVLINGEPLPVELTSGEEVTIHWKVKNTVYTEYVKVKYHIYAQMGEERITLVAWDDWKPLNIPGKTTVTFIDTFTAPASGNYTLILYIIDASTS